METRGRGPDRRRAGVLLHPTSLPGPYGVGDLGPAAEGFLDWAVEAGLGLWQVLPLGPTSWGDSPYGCLSAYAGNPLLVSPERLVEDGLLPRPALAGAPDFDRGRVDYAAVRAWKEPLLRASFAHYARHGPRRARAAEEAFVAAVAAEGWLEDWGLYCALKDRHGGRAWTEWEPGVRRRDPEALAAARAELAEEIAYHRYAQFLFDFQWQRLRARARALDVVVLGDLPIYVAGDSADVWTRPDLFQLDAEGRPTVVAGVPPDYFSATGQRWGNPLYRWERMAAEGYAWWLARLRANLRQADLVRLDHFRGFAGYWEIPAAEKTAAGGRWVPGPGRALFDALRRGLGGLPLVAEDLGVITPDVEALRDELGLPGMRVLQFAFGGDHNPHAPHRHTPATVVYTGTHDNDTSRGWLESLGAEERARLDDYLGGGGDDAWRLVRAAYTSVANLCVVPLQDLLGLGSEARMNTPARASGNWAWRVPSEALTPGVAATVRRLARLTGRSPASDSAAG